PARPARLVGPQPQPDRRHRRRWRHRPHRRHRGGGRGPRAAQSAPQADRGRDLVGPGDRDGDDPGPAVRLLGLRLTDPGRPVIGWAGWPFHRATALYARHGSVTMDTLITVGTGAAFLWSIIALFLGTAGEPGTVHHFSLTLERTGGLSDIYLEVAAGVITFVL